MITKEKLQEHIEKLPDEIHIEELIDRLIFIDKREKRIQASDNNDVISEGELDKETQKWFK